MQKFLVALALTGLVDAISYMVVAPSIVFYVMELGGTKEQYGVILSAFSFASFCAKPFLGAWCDNIGFRAPYIMSLIVSALGGLLYLLASAFEGQKGVHMILAGRLLGGVGAANSALGFAYLSKMVPNDQQTRTNSLLSMIRILGMAGGPGVNVFLAKIDTYIGNFHLNSLNSVGLVLVVSNILAMITIFFLLEEPPAKNGDEKKEGHENRPSLSRGDEYNIAKAVMSAGILVPMLSIFGFNANFQLIETGFAPAANHALGWGPVQTSAVLGSVSVIICVNMFAVFALSGRGVTDEHLVTFGLTLSAVGYTSLYFCWKMGVSVVVFCLPIVLGASSFPFLGAPTRSIFTKYVDRSPCLDKFQGTMQAVLSMAASVAGFVTPSFVAVVCLRHPEEVEASADKREMNPWALFAPILSLITLVGFIYIMMTEKEAKRTTDASIELKTDEEGGTANEQTSLLDGRTSIVDELPDTVLETRTFSPKVERHRRHSACLMGLAQTSFNHEHVKLKRVTLA